MPGKTTTPSVEAVPAVRKNSLEGASPDWDTCQDSPSDWRRERGDSMKSGSSKSGENGSVLSSTSTADVNSAPIVTSGLVESAKEAKEKEHMMKRTSSWMKNLGNGMRTLRLRKGSGTNKKKEKLDNGIMDEDNSTSTKGDGEVPENTPPVSSPASPSVSTGSKSKKKDKKKKGDTERKQDDDPDPAPTTIVVPVPEPPLPAPSVPEHKSTAATLVSRLSKGKKKVTSDTSGQNGGALKPASENSDKTDPARFIGEGLCFKAKLIGVLEVSGPRGDRICQEALSELKMAVKAAGEHKQKVTIHVALDGLRLRDEKTGDCLYHHQVHKISFIAQDLTDTRAFGYIFGSPDTGHRFFGIKTEKSASQVVMAMRDLFQVVFDLKKKEIERAKLQLEMQQKFLATRAAETAPRHGHKSDLMDEACALSSPSAPAEADLLNLEVELNSLQEGLENIHSNLADTNSHNSVFNRGSTASISSDPMNPMSPGFKYSTVSAINNANSTSNSTSSGIPSALTVQPRHGNANSFCDSFDPFDSNTAPGKMWPSHFTSDPFSQVDPFAQVDPFPKPKFTSFDSGGDTCPSDPFDTSAGIQPSTCQENVISSTNGGDAVTKIPTLQSSNDPRTTAIVMRKDSVKSQASAVQESPSATNGQAGSISSSNWMASFEDNFVPQPGSNEANGMGQPSGRASAGLDIFTELDPLGTGKMKPFVDRKDFFNDLKNPPKRVLNELAAIPTTVNPPSDQTSILPLPSLAAVSSHPSSVLQVQEPTIHNSFSTHFNPSNSSGGAHDFDSHFKFPKTELRTSSIRARGDSPPNYSPPPPPPASSASACNSVYFINPPISQLTPPTTSSSRSKKSPGLLKHITISNTPTANNQSNSSPKTLPRSTRLGKPMSTSEYSEEIPSLTPPPPPRPPPSNASTLTRNSGSAVPRPHSGNESRRQNYATLSSISGVPPEPPPRPLQTTMISDMSSSFPGPPLVSPPPPLPPKKQAAGPTLSSSVLGKLLYTCENSSGEVEIRNGLPLPLPSRRNGNSSTFNSSSQMPRYALPAENSTSSPILYNRKKIQPAEVPVQPDAPPTAPRLQMTMDQALNHVASMSLGQLAGKLGLPVTQLSYLTINQLAEQLTLLDLRRNSDVCPKAGFGDSFEFKHEAKLDIAGDHSEISAASAPAVIDGSKSKSTTNFDKYAVFRELTLEDASGFSLEDDGVTKTLTALTSRDSSSERTLQADDGLDVDMEQPLTTMDDITDMNFSDADEDGNEKLMLDDEVVDLNTKSEWATFESNFDEQFVPLSKSESPWESDAEGEADQDLIGMPSNTVINTSEEPEPRDQFDFVPFEKPPLVEHKRRGSNPLNSLDEPKFQRQSSSSSKHSDRSGGAVYTGGPTTGSHHSHGKTNASDCSVDSGKERPFSGSSSGRRYSRDKESDEDWSLAPPPGRSASARKIRSHRHYRDEESPQKPRKEIVNEVGDEEDDRSHASYHSTNSYSRDRRQRRYYPHPHSSKYYDGRHSTSQSLQRHGCYKGRRSRAESPDRYSNHESDVDDSFEDEAVRTASGRRRYYNTREEYWSAGSRPSSSGSGRRYQQPSSRRDRDRPDSHNNSYHSRDGRFGHGNHSRPYRDRDRERDSRGRHERKGDFEIEENVSDFSEEDGRRRAGPRRKDKGRRPPYSQPHGHRSERDSRHRYYYTNSPSWDSESSPPPDQDPPGGRSAGRDGSERPSSASQAQHSNSFVNTPPAEDRHGSARSRHSQGRGNAKYQSELSLNTSRKLSASEFRFDDNDFKSNSKARPDGEANSLNDAGSGTSGRVSETGSNTKSQRPPASPFEDNFVTPGPDPSKHESETEAQAARQTSEDVFFPAKFDFDSQTVEQIKLEDESIDNSLDVSDKSVESLQETPPSQSLDMKNSIDSIEADMKKSNSFNIFVRETDPFEDDDFFK